VLVAQCICTAVVCWHHLCLPALGADPVFVSLRHCSSTASGVCLDGCPSGTFSTCQHAAAGTLRCALIRCYVQQAAAGALPSSCATSLPPVQCCVSFSGRLIYLCSHETAQCAPVRLIAPPVGTCVCAGWAGMLCQLVSQARFTHVRSSVLRSFLSQSAKHAGGRHI
jgi:uncharacterized membrane protein YgdD (TMEM256/DUF423 family)